LLDAKLYPRNLVEKHRKAIRGLYDTFDDTDSLKNPTVEWAVFERSCSMRDMRTHLCALPTGEHGPRGPVCLGCVHAQRKKSGTPIVFRRMLASHERPLAAAKLSGEPAGQLAAGELEVGRIRGALKRAQELSADVAAAIESAADLVSTLPAPQVG
jgi:hypothetical protein